MYQQSRIPAAIVLTVILAAGAWVLLDPRVFAQAGENHSLKDLELAVAQPDAKPAVWFSYAQALQQHKRYDYAAMAYRKFLEFEPYNRDAKLYCALSLAKSDNRDEFHKFMRELVLTEPKLAVDVLDRPECQPALAEVRFQVLAKEAKVQSMD